MTEVPKRPSKTLSWEEKKTESITESKDTKERMSVLQPGVLYQWQGSMKRRVLNLSF